jgi:hypothetical protein
MRDWLEVFNAYAGNIKDPAPASQAAASIYKVALQAHLAGRKIAVHVRCVSEEYAQATPAEQAAVAWAVKDVADVLARESAE